MNIQAPTSQSIELQVEYNTKVKMYRVYHFGNNTRFNS